MGKYHLREFEEIVLLTVGALYEGAYGVSIKRALEERLNRKVSVGSLQTALKKLEKKSYLTSREGEGTIERHGRPKRYFTLTAVGKDAIEYASRVRNQLYNENPKVALDLKIVGG